MPNRVQTMDLHCTKPKNLGMPKREYRSALLLNPNLIDANLNLAALYRYRNRRADAVARYKKVLSLERENEVARIGLAQTLLDLRQFNQAEDELRLVLRANPNSVTAKHALGLALAQAGNPAEAESILREITIQTPNDARAWYNLGGILRAQKTVGRIGECISPIP